MLCIIGVCLSFIELNEAHSSSCHNVVRNDERWGTGPSWNTANTKPPMGGEFVPMITQVGMAEEVMAKIDWYIAEWTRANVHFLLG